MEHVFQLLVWEVMTSKYTQSVQQTVAGSEKTADVVCSRETTVTVDVNADSCQFVNALDVTTTVLPVAPSANVFSC